VGAAPVSRDGLPMLRDVVPANRGVVSVLGDVVHALRADVSRLRDVVQAHLDDVREDHDTLVHTPSGAPHVMHCFCLYEACEWQLKQYFGMKYRMSNPRQLRSPNSA
jgi:hypothetical protein